MTKMEIRRAEQDGDIRYVPDGKNNLSFCGAAHLSRYQWAKTFACSSFECLDFGCGSGYGAYFLSSYVKHMDAVDISENAINYAKEKYIRDNLTFFNANLEEKIRLQKQYDLILSFDVVEHVNDVGFFFENTAKLLKRDGHFLCGTPNKLQTLKWNRDWNPFHKQEFTPEELRNALLEFYDSVEIRGQDISSVSQKNQLQKNATGKKSLGTKVRRIIRALKHGITLKRDMGRHVHTDDISFHADANESFGLIAICSHPKIITHKTIVK